MADDIVKQGYVKFQSKSLGNIGVWNKQWLMLRRQSCKGPLRLEKYKDEEKAAIKSVYGADRKIIDLTKVDRIERIPDSVKKHAVSILVDATLQLQFSVGSEMEAESWLSAIRDELHPENRASHESFYIYLLPNDFLSSEGECVLKLERDSVHILERYGNEELVRWPLSTLRRYSADNDVVTIETGSSSPTGAGTFRCRSADSDLIFRRMQSLTQALSSTTNNAPNRSFTESNWGNVQSIHELGRRREAAGTALGGNAGMQAENNYQFDDSMPTNRPPRRSNTSARDTALPPRPTAGDSGEYSELPGNGGRNTEYSVSSSSSTPSVGRQQSGRNAVNAAPPSAGVEFVGVGGPYYAVSRPRNTNQSGTNQRERDDDQAIQENMLNESRQSSGRRNNSVSGPAGPSSNQRRPPTEDQIRSVRVEGAYYAVARPGRTTQAEGSAINSSSRSTNAQGRANLSQPPSSSMRAGRSRRGTDDTPLYNDTPSYNAAQGDDPSSDGPYSVPAIDDRLQRSMRR